MRGRRGLLVILVALGTACRPTPTVDPSKPEAFSLQTSLQPARGERLQRVSLPPRMLAAVQRSDLGDIRAFDATGRVVPLGLLGGAAMNNVRRKADLRIYPVLGSGKDLSRSDLSIRVESDGITRAVTVDQASRPADMVHPPAAALLDTRALRDPVNAIVLDADLPAGRPITMTLLASTDLQDWQPLAQKVLFQPDNGDQPLGGTKVALGHVQLRDHYVGISWGGASGVRLKGAQAITAGGASSTFTVIATRGSSLTDPHELRFDLPSGAPPSSIRINASKTDGVIPVRLFGRSSEDQPWALLSVATLQPESGAATLDLAAPQLMSYRLEADRRTAGFSAPPQAELLFPPVELLVALSGSPPYRLAAGQAGAAPSFLSLEEIAPRTSLVALDELPRATLADTAAPPPTITLQAGASDGALDPRKLSLWAALLLGTLVLAFAAIRLLRAKPARETVGPC
jgi:Protein of unknown function (DUF3999)